MSDIASNILKLKSELPANVRLVAVTKKKTVEDIFEAYNAGHKCFGENKAQELLAKKDFLPADIEWHFIGHLQTNKVKFIVPFVSMIQSVDSVKLLAVINNEAAKAGKVVNCLLQLYIAEEETKFGFDMDELISLFESKTLDNLNNIKICGLMGMASFTDNVSQVKKEFTYLKECFDKLKAEYFGKNLYFKEISIGMSGDYKIAIEAGSTMVRIGSMVFGERKKFFKK
jgi:pyridoxal phosphate enzyme (YggS family)